MPRTPEAASPATDSPTAAPTNLPDDLIDAMAPLLAQQRQKWAERCHAHGLSLMGAHALALLEMHGPMPMSRLADDLGVALPNATGIVGRLAERGIVDREHADADRRVVLVSLNETGRQLIGEMEEARRRRIRRLVEELDPEQQQRLLHAVRDLRAAAVKVDGA
jgi:DNA-binding MarR family transcriptional regulator